MNDYETALDLAAKIEAAGVAATCDPRSATPPCVLIPPPRLDRDTFCSALATFELMALAPGTGNADMWVALNDLEAAVRSVVPIERREFVRYTLATDSPPLPAYRLTFTQGVDV